MKGDGLDAQQAVLQSHSFMSLGYCLCEVFVHALCPPTSKNRCAGPGARETHEVSGSARISQHCARVNPRPLVSIAAARAAPRDSGRGAALNGVTSRAWRQRVCESTSSFLLSTLHCTELICSV
ncbi:uncharacterized [Tachysurus ichikawai]